MLALMSSASMGFSAGNHKSLSIAAITYYKNNCAIEDRHLQWVHPGYLGKGSKKEDNPRPARLTNWHFYHPEKDFKAGKKGQIDPRPTKFLNEAKDKILKEIEKGRTKQLSEAIGSYIHYIQDLANPAHIAPIYHDPRTKDKFDEWTAPIYSIFHGDFCSDTDEKYRSILAHEEYKGDLADNLDLILDVIFSETKGALDQSFAASASGAPTTLKWSSFWNLCEENRFCEYEESLLENNFGKAVIWISPSKPNRPGSCISGDSCEVKISFSEYHKFATQQARIAAIYSLVAARLVADQYYAFHVKRDT